MKLNLEPLPNERMDNGGVSGRKEREKDFYIAYKRLTPHLFSPRSPPLAKIMLTNFSMQISTPAPDWKYAPTSEKSVTTNLYLCSFTSYK